LAIDKSRNHIEIGEEIEFWHRLVQEWKAKLPSASNGAADATNDETLLKDVDRFLTLMKPIKDCQWHIQQLAQNNVRTREEIAKETWFWHGQQQEWKAKLL